MVKKEEDEKFEAEKRKTRMRELEDRIGSTESGSRFLDRIYEIGKPRPLRDDDSEQGE